MVDSTQNTNSDVRSVNGELDKRYNQGLDWFLNSEYYTANVPVTFLYVNEANYLESSGLPWHTRREVGFSKEYTVGDKVIIYYANEAYMSYGNAESNTVPKSEKTLIDTFLKKHNVPLKDVILVGNSFEFNKCHTRLGLDLGLKLDQILMIDYYELQTYFFHKVLGSDYNKAYNPTATKDLRYLFGKIDKPIRIMTMYKLWQKGLLDNAVTGCLVDYNDIDSLAIQVSVEFDRWYNKTVDKNSIADMLKKYYGSPDNVKYYYFTILDQRTKNDRRLFNKINHCPSYPYNHEILFSDSKVSLVPETYFYFNQADFITEKTYKTIYNHHPFTILGTPGILKTLKSKGYRTFDGICDEIYDDCSNDRKRVDLVISATQELLKTTQHKEIDAITKHNFEQLEKNSLETVKNLNNIILSNFS